MAEQCFGGRQISYAVIDRNKKKNGRIEVYVFHRNKAFRKVIKNNQYNPRFFLDRYDTNSGNMAQKHMAHLVKAYRSYFERGLLDFMFMELN